MNSSQIGMLIAGLLFMCAAIVFEFVALFTNYWKQVTITHSTGSSFTASADISVHHGLFEFCIDTGFDDVCKTIEEPDDYIIRTRSLIASAIALTFIALFLALFHSFKVHHRSASRGVVYIMEILTTLAILFLVIATIVYGVNLKEGDEIYAEEYGLGYSFFINIVSFIILVIGSVLIEQSYQAEQTSPVASGAVVVQAYPVGQPIPGTSYGQPVLYGQPAYGQPQPYATAASGQPMPPGYGQQQFPTPAGTTQPMEPTKDQSNPQPPVAVEY